MAYDQKSDLIEILVADSAAFLKNVPLQKMAKNIYTINEVVGEIKSPAVRQRLAVLPYEISFRLPSSDSLHVVSEFAKKTGDFQSLSLVDLKVLALTYQLHKEKCGIDGLRSEPTKQVEVVNKSVQGNVPGFYVKNENHQETAEDCKEELSTDAKEVNLVKDMKQCSFDNEVAKEEKVVDKNIVENKLENIKNITDNVVDQKENVNKNEVDVQKDEDEHNGDTNDNNEEQSIDNDDDQTELDGHDNSEDHHSNSDDSYDDDDDDDDGGDWITPENIGQVKADYGISEAQSKPVNISVGCLTTDFAMQNVLIQMGLHVISVEGMLIKEARSYVLKCYSCFKVTSQMQRMFCPKCGNRTLVKVSVSVNEEGVTRYHMPKRNRPFNIRGKKHPLPLPKGGRHNNNPLLFEDQLISQRRLPKSKDKVNVLDEDYVARSSPFTVNDTTSRAFNLGFHVRGQNKRNPNEARKKTRRKK
ncbi:RNA-binding protein NOB1-like [Dendronephthya gigantea]|uniref:RNA-binding protein NOB1-like n=1 Tax=Dendronephthya gigantea TaxID=151771 RepID=UPI0010699B24|nr:RNA-binding protein NOB1-like [Dendronephthya gigantea]